VNFFNCLNCHQDKPNQNQVFHYSRRISLMRVMRVTS